MYRKGFVFLMTLVFAFGCATGALGEAANMEALFVPQQFVELYNEGLSTYASMMYPDDATHANQIASQLMLYYDETDDGIVYYDNQARTVELSGYYEDAEPYADRPASTLTFSIDENHESELITLADLSMCMTLCVLGGTADDETFMEYGSFVDQGWTQGSQVLKKDGFVLAAMYYSPRYMLAIFHNEG